MTFNFSIDSERTLLPMAINLLNELELISKQAEEVATALRQLNLDPAVLEQLQPNAGAGAQRITCRLETAAEAARGLG